MAASSTIPLSAQRGFANASSYDRHRPSYPADAVEQLLSNLNMLGQKGARIVDLAAGTGKLTETLSARPEGYDILAIEPHDGMREELERKGLPNVTTLKGVASEMPLENQSVDALIVAQAFHWFATEETLREIHRVLRPGGGFGMVWNIEDYNSPRSQKASSPWEEKVQELVWTFDDETPRYRHEKWRNVFDDQIRATNPWSIQKADPLFSLPLGESKIPFTRWMTKEAIWDRIHTLSQIAILDGEELERVKKIVMDALDEEAADVEQNEKGEVSLHGRIVLAHTVAIPAAPLDYTS